jgi:hypothetical protein
MPNSQDCNLDSILIKADRIYQHSLLHINYTTYDVRRSQDVVNALTSRCNIMVYNDDSGGDDTSEITHIGTLGF